MANITLRVTDRTRAQGHLEPLLVEMPSVTTGKYAFARVIEALGGDSDAVVGYLAPVATLQKYPSPPVLETTPDYALQDDEIVADWDGRLVVPLVRPNYEER